ncbi:MAG: nucleoside triphosphate pyrophosphohydrolase [Flavobacteriales bacterium]|nr:nucleoside triphosphate pyrophosphohydrolase [Flavobacteriales bacterium]MDG1440830.1 nucleoside triphosphate pyrophosphohydrolase [Flavobacteriales bacterium]
MENSSSFNRLLTIMDQLRAECPWDQKQTMESLSHLTIEETYELMDAILNNDMKEIKGELGDLLLHIVFYSKIASESDAFDINDVIQTICDKLVERHPHIYGDEIAKTEEDVKKNWEKIKLKSGRKSVLEGVPKSLPAMVKATRIQEKARGIGFDWENSHQVFEKVKEEFEELHVELNENENTKEVEKEFGDVLFSMINYARFIGVDPESALERTNKKFISRFTFLEQEIKLKGLKMDEMTLGEMDLIWNKSKKNYP